MVDFPEASRRRLFCVPRDSSTETPSATRSKRSSDTPRDDMQVIRIYCDECGRGLRGDGRSGLQQMFRDMEDGAGDFDAIGTDAPFGQEQSRWRPAAGRGHREPRRATHSTS